jgi:hypothetical protein
MRIEKEVIKFSAALAPRAGGSIFITCADRYFLDIIFFTKELERLIAKRDVYDAERKYGTAYEEISQYPYYIDLLRNADRAYMRFDIALRDLFLRL